MLAKDRIIVALDVDSVDKATALAEQLSPHVGGFKIGLEFITAMIVSIVSAADNAMAHLVTEKIRRLFKLLSGQVFWDGKFADIPNTVGAVSKIVGATLNVRMFNVHASAGIEAMMAAVANKGQSRVFAVTVLTSLEENNAFLTFGAPSQAPVVQFARDAKLAECDGIICSPQELAILGKQKELVGLAKVTPGIRALNAPADDQKRTMSAREAILAGADELVIGRPITGVANPVEAAQNIAKEISAGLKERFHMALFDLAKIKFGAFRLKLHEKHPDAPLSPIYLNIRDLPDSVYGLAGDILHEIIKSEGILLGGIDYVIGIPKAGEPIGRALAKAVGKPLLRIEKIEGVKGRRISTNILDPFEKGKLVVLVDDLVTKAETKREAIESVEANGLKVATTIVLYDREQGGLAELNGEGRRVFAAARLGETLDFFVLQKKISPEKKDEVMAYIAAN